MRLTAKEKVSYGLGAVDKDMVYMLSASYHSVSGQHGGLWEII